jgi:hypothetical protein
VELMDMQQVLLRTTTSPVGIGIRKTMNGLLYLWFHVIVT